jgi:hypothetical protein
MPSAIRTAVVRCTVTVARQGLGDVGCIPPWDVQLLRDLKPMSTLALCTVVPFLKSISDLKILEIHFIF